MVSKMTKVAIKTIINSMLNNYSNFFVIMLVQHNEEGAKPFADLFNEQKRDLFTMIDNIDEEDFNDESI